MTATEREAARQAAWREYRPELARRHAEFRRKCDEDEEGVRYLQPQPLPTTAPDWF